MINKLIILPDQDTQKSKTKAMTIADKTESRFFLRFRERCNMDERVSVSVRVAVCSHISKNHIVKLHQFLCWLVVAVVRFSSDGVAIRYVIRFCGRVTNCSGMIAQKQTGTIKCSRNRKHSGDNVVKELS